MRPEHLQKEALLQSLPASRQNVLRKQCTRRLIDYQELKALVKTQVDRALANYGASKNWEDIVQPHPATADSLTEWFDDWCQAGPCMRGGVSHHMAMRQFFKALYVSNAYEGHLDAMLFDEAKQNGKFSYLEAFCFILPRLVSKKRAKVTKQNNPTSAPELHDRVQDKLSLSKLCGLHRSHSIYTIISISSTHAYGLYP